MERLGDGVRFAKGSINGLFANKEPWQIVAITTTAVLGTVWVYECVNQEESVSSRLKKRFFRLVRRIPAVGAQIEKEINKTTVEFENNITLGMEEIPYIRTIPEEGLSHIDILDKVDKYLALGHYNWKEGKISGGVYYYDPKLIELTSAVYGKASYTNPLHPDVFPGVCKMEAEVVRITANLFNGGHDVCGTMTTGGTESIIMAVKAYRDFAREEHGITKPNIVVPATIHSAFDKASQYLGIHVRSVKVDQDTMTVNLKEMERLITGNTIMLGGSAPNFPYGTQDNIEAIAALGRKYNIPVHVDACLGGFLIVFMEKAGYSLKPYDFRVDGVTSISADTHKYGFAPKGSSVILYSDKKYRNHQYTVTTDWPGGVYGSPSVNGSRAGGIIAATWATLLNFGHKGYIEATRKIIDTARFIEAELRKIEGIFIFGTPATSVIGIGSNVFDIFRLSDSMSSRGWSLNPLQFPSGVHICVTYTHTGEGIKETFISDVKEIVAELMINPEKPVEGKMAIYGIAQKVPDRTVVGDFTRCFLNSMYFIPPEQ